MSFVVYRDEYYKNLPEKELPDTLEEMQPLFRAVEHGCAAGLHQRALDEVYWPLIRRKDEHYITEQLGAFNDDLSTAAHFFSPPFERPSISLIDFFQNTLLNIVGFDLRAIGRLNEAAMPMQSSLDMRIKQKDWGGASTQARNLSKLNLVLGDIGQAAENSRRGISYSDKSHDIFEQVANQTTYACVLHQSGECFLALGLYQKIQTKQRVSWSNPRLYTLADLYYFDFLLAQGKAQEVLNRLNHSMRIVKQSKILVDVALYEWAFGCSYMQLQDFSRASKCFDNAIAGLRTAGRFDHLPLGLLARSALYRQTGKFPYAFQDLQDAYEICKPSGMRLHLTNYHLEMARLLSAEGKEKPQHHIQSAAKLIQETGYHRRDQELVELQKVIN